MLLKPMLDLFEVLDDPAVNGTVVRNYLLGIKSDAQITVQTLTSSNGTSDVISIMIPGSKGKSTGGVAPTTGIIGQLGSLGGRPSIVGFVSDGDGALTALTIAAKLLDMYNKGDRLRGDVIVATSIAPTTQTTPNYPVPNIVVPVPIHDLNEAEVTAEMDAVFSIDATKGNNIINYRGFTISPVLKQGYILPPTADLLNLMATTTGKVPYVFPVSTYDVTPYESGFTHINSIMSPNIFTSSPFVGVAINTQTSVGGSAPGANHFLDLEDAARFVLEAAKAFGNNTLTLYDETMYNNAVTKYGSLAQFQS